MKLSIPFSLTVILSYCLVAVLGSPQGVSGGNYWTSKAVAPLPAQHKNVSTGNHGSNLNDTESWSLCANSIGYVYDSSAGICSRTGRQAHCGKNMIFYKSGRFFGSCDCNHATKVPLFPVNYQNGTNRCFYIYTQAHCASGYWLEPDYQGVIRCLPNRCYSNGTTFGKPALASRDRTPEYVPLNSNGTCTRLFHYSPLCRWNEIVTFAGKNKYASCFYDIYTYLGGRN